jgi:hypothetical protein
MPTNRRRRRQGRRSEPLTLAARVFLETGDVEAAVRAEAAADPFEILLLRRQSAAIWAEHGEEFLADWIDDHPGTRPWGWWAYCSPEPRRRLGGTGTPAHEVLAHAPACRFGIPVTWVTPWDVAYYTGRARDVHGQPIGTESRPGHFRGKAIDSRNPPRYESEAAYLDRLGLLSAAERRALPPDAFEPERAAASVHHDDGAEGPEEDL